MKGMSTIFVIVPSACKSWFFRWVSTLSISFVQSYARSVKSKRYWEERTTQKHSSIPFASHCSQIECPPLIVLPHLEKKWMWSIAIFKLWFLSHIPCQPGWRQSLPVYYQCNRLDNRCFVQHVIYLGLCKNARTPNLRESVSSQSVIYRFVGW